MPSLGPSRGEAAEGAFGRLADEADNGSAATVEMNSRRFMGEITAVTPLTDVRSGALAPRQRVRITTGQIEGPARG